MANGETLLRATTTKDTRKILIYGIEIGHGCFIITSVTVENISGKIRLDRDRLPFESRNIMEKIVFNEANEEEKAQLIDIILSIAS